MDTEGSCGLQGSPGDDCKVASLTPWTIWGPHGRRGKETEEHFSSSNNCRWSGHMRGFQRVSDIGQFPINPAVWVTQNVFFIGQERFTG